MATVTPNLNLELPLGTENVSRQLINSNNTKIDTFAGEVQEEFDNIGTKIQEIIDDTAGFGYTDKVWSADKSTAEVTDLKDAITYNSQQPSITFSQESEGKYIGANGVIGNSSSFHYSDLIDVSQGNGIFAFDYSGDISTIRVHGYSGDGVWIEQLGYKSTAHSGTIAFNIPNYVSKVRVSCPISASVSIRYESLIKNKTNEMDSISEKHGEDIKGISEYLFGTNNIGYPISFENGGYIGLSSGNKLEKTSLPSLVNKRKVLTTTFIDVADRGITIKTKTGYRMTVLYCENQIISGVYANVTEYALKPNSEYGILLYAQNTTDDISNVDYRDIVSIDYQDERLSCLYNTNTSLIEWDADLDGYYIDQNGNVGANQDYHVSKIKNNVCGNSVAVFVHGNGTGTLRIHGYSGESFVKELTHKTVDSTGKTYYVYFDTLDSVRKIDGIRISAPKAEQEINILTNSIDYIDQKVDEINEKYEIPKDSVELDVTWDDEFDGKYITQSSYNSLPIGVVGSQSDMHCSDKIQYVGGQSSLRLSYRGEGRVVRIHKYGRTGKWIGQIAYKAVSSGDYTINFNADEGTSFIRISCPKSATNVRLFTNVYAYIDSKCSEAGWIHEMPSSQGALNLVKRAYQMSKLSYIGMDELFTVTDELAGDEFPTGTQVTGILYSAPRELMNYVPQCASIHSYMTAIKNPNSYIYTKPISNSKLAHSYYGGVCSSLVAYAYGIDSVVPTTISFATYPGFEELPASQQNIESLKIGDMLNWTPGGDSGHIVIITDIIRTERGELKYIEVTETFTPYATTHLDTPESFKYFREGYSAYRYAYIDDIEYEESEWVNVFGYNTSPTWNHNLLPRRGDKANWRVGETIEIDVLNAEDYTNYVLYNIDTGIVNTDSIASLISINNLPTGKYKVYLTDGSNESDPVFFNVMSETATFTPDGDGHVTVTFTSTLGTASGVQFFSSLTNEYKFYGLAFHVLSDAEIEAGEATINIPTLSPSMQWYCPNNLWGMRVMYKTEYGLYGGDIQYVTLT